MAGLRLIGILAAVLMIAAPVVRAEDKAAVDPFDQSKVPLEVDTDDTKLTKIVLVAGSKSHGPGEHEFFAGSAILMKLLQETPGVFPVMARDGWPKNEKIFENAKAIVFYMDGGGGHPLLRKGHMDLMQTYIDKGVGFVNLHYAVEYPKGPEAGDRILKWLAGYYETGYSINPTWKANYKELPEHAITRGVKPFSIQDEWYYNMRWAEDKTGVTELLRDAPPDGTRGTPDAKAHPGRIETMAWAFERPGDAHGRSFGFTGGHFHQNWGDENYRRLVTNAILWSAHVEVPKEGAKVDLDPAELKKNMDKK